jgi:hypothetical protein
VKNVKSQLAISRKAFAAFESSNQLKHHVFSGGHRWCGERSISWLQLQLQA